MSAVGWRGALLVWAVGSAAACRRPPREDPPSASVTAPDVPTTAPRAPAHGPDKPSPRRIAPAWTAAFHMRNRAFAFERVPDVVVHAPHGFDPSRPMHLVVLLHGTGGSAAQWMVTGEVELTPGIPVDGVGMDSRHDMAASNTLLIAPQFDLARPGRPWSGGFGRPGFFRLFLTELLGETLAPRLGGAHTLDQVEALTLVGSSAGGGVITELLSLGDLADRVQNVVLFDGLYGGETTLASWLLARAPRAPRRLVCVHAGSVYTAPHAAALAQRLSSLGDAVAVSPSGPLANAVRAHRAVFATVPCEHVGMSVVYFDKVLRGLDLPPRAPEAIDAPHTPQAAALPAASPIARGASVTASLSATDPSLRDGARFDDYALDLPEARAVEVEVHGGAGRGLACGALDMEAQILDGAATLATDDDGAGGLRARMVFTPPRPGRYTLRVSSHGPLPYEGAYTVRISR